MRPPTHTEIIWDIYDVPHIYASSSIELFHAFGWAQARNHLNLLLRLYAQSRGCAAQYWGPRFVASDRWVRMMGVPSRSTEWLGLQTPEFRRCLDAFASGVNRYVREFPEAASPHLRVVLPINARDVVAHTQRVLNFSMVVNPEQIAGALDGQHKPGSNAWAIGPLRSVSNNPLLLINPHVPWADFFRCFEAHLSLSGRNAYGITFVGFPVLVMAFNDLLGWAHTVNTYKGWTLYEFDGSDKGYVFDSRRHGFEQQLETLYVRQDDGSISPEPLVVRRSVHGPVIGQRADRLLALRVAGLDRARALEQWWNMTWANGLESFENALREMQVPMFSVLYAGRDGHIMHFCNGQIPIRKFGDYSFWDDIVRGDTSDTLWNATHEYDDLPRIVDPPSGWLHNANDPPWTTTFPRVLNASDYPDYVAPPSPMSLRAQRSAKLLLSRDRFAFDDLVQAKYCARVELADRVLDELIELALASDRTNLQPAATVLAHWDRFTNPDSRGAVLFMFWWQLVQQECVFREPWSERDPLSTPRGLADPESALQALEKATERVLTDYGRLDVAWGDVFKLRGNGIWFPALGADKMGVFSELWFIPSNDKQFAAIGGDAFTAIIEFSDPVRASVLNMCGNSTQELGAAQSSQLSMFATRQMRPALLERRQILGHVSCVTHLSYERED